MYIYMYIYMDVYILETYIYIHVCIHVYMIYIYIWMYIDGGYIHIFIYIYYILYLGIMLLYFACIRSMPSSRLEQAGSMQGSSPSIGFGAGALPYHISLTSAQEPHSSNKGTWIRAPAESENQSKAELRANSKAGPRRANSKGNIIDI